MTLISWCMFVLGLAIGLGVTAWVSVRMMGEELKGIKDNHEFLTKYAELTDNQYADLKEHIHKRFEILNEFANGLADICSRMVTENKEFGTKVFEALIKDNENKNKFLKELEETINYNETVNERRWNLICDYITNKEPEFDNKPEPEPLCKTCRYKASDGGAGYTEVCSTCSEMALCNYDPEHVYLQTNEEEL